MKKSFYVAWEYSDAVNIIGLKVIRKDRTSVGIITGVDLHVDSIYGSYNVMIGRYGVNFSILFEEWEQLNETPCGKEISYDA